MSTEGPLESLEAYNLPPATSHSATEVANILRTRPVTLRVSFDGRGDPMEHGWSDGHLCFVGRVGDVTVTGTDALDILANHLSDDALLVQWTPLSESERLYRDHHPLFKQEVSDE